MRECPAMLKTDLSELKIDVVFDLPDGRRCVAQVSGLERPIRVPWPMKGGFGCIDYEWSGESDAQGRPIYK